MLAIVNTLGLIASAGVGVAEKVCAFIMLIPLAFMQAMSAFVAQNHGAGKPERAIEGLKTPEVVAAGFDYLKAYGIDCLLTCFLFCFIGFYNGLGRTGFVMLQGIAAAFLIRIPVAYIMCQTTGRLFNIGLGIPCSTVFQILLCFAYFSRVRRKR